MEHLEIFFPHIWRNAKEYAKIIVESHIMTYTPVNDDLSIDRHT